MQHLWARTGHSQGFAGLRLEPGRELARQACHQLCLGSFPALAMTSVQDGLYLEKHTLVLAPCTFQ
jgi:hypothetical protein